MFKNLFKKDKSSKYASNNGAAKPNDLGKNGKKYNIFYILKYTDWIDKLLLSIGLFAGIASSGLYPTAFWIYGKIVTAFVTFGILKENMRLRQQGVNFTQSRCQNQNPDPNFQVDQAVYEAIYYYVYFGFPVLFAHLISYLAWGIAAERISIKLRGLLYSSIIKQDLNWFETFNSEETNALYATIEKLRSGTGEKLSDFIILITRAIGSVIFGLYSTWKLGLVLSSVLPLSIIFFVITVLMTKKFTIQEGALNLKSGSLFRQVFNSIRTVLVYGGESKELEKYENSLKKIEKLSIKKGLILGVTSGLSTFFNYSSYAIWIGYGTYLFRNECQTFSAGNIIQTFSSFIISALAVSQAFPFVKELGDANLAANKLFKMLNLKSSTNIFDTESGIKLESGKVRGRLTFKDMNFFYRNRPNKMVLKDINIDIDEGKTVAMIGPSGCGKTTVIKLIARLFDPSFGKILFDNHDIQDLNLNWWRSQLSIVSQDPVLFNMSFRENIRLGNIEASDQEVEEAAKAADIHNHIMESKNGYNTIIEHGGSRLSGGQRQRISIARAFLRNKQSNLLIFDEATSALDNQTEKHIQNSIEKLKSNKTTVIIAHRLSTIRSADLIIELKDGVVNDVGNHDQLMANKGYYYSLVMNDEDRIKHELAARAEEELEQNAINVARLSSISQFRVRIDDNRQSIISNRVSKPVEEKKKPKFGFYALKVWKMNTPELLWIILAGMAYFLNGAIYPFTAFCFSEMIKIFTINDPDRNTQQSYLFTGIVIGLSVLSFIASFLLNFATTKSGTRLTIRAKIKLFKALLCKEMGWFDLEENKLSNLITGMSTCPGLLKGYTAERIGFLLNFITGVGLPFAISMYFSWKLTLVVSLFIPIALIWGFMQGQVIRNNRNLTGYAKIDRAVQCATESVLNIHTVMINNLQGYFKTRLEKEFRSNLKRITIVIFIESIFYGIGYVLFFFVQCTAFSYGSILLKNGEVEGYNIVRIFASILFSSMFLGKTISTLTDIPKAKKAAEWYFKTVDETEDAEQDEFNKITLENFKGDIILENVKFCYMNQRDKIILRNINCEFKNNESSAIVGKSGCGKSTIMSLLLKFYGPYSGSVLIDGVDIDKIKTKWLRKQIGLVSQQFDIFEGTIKDNITYGLNDNEYTEQDVINAAKKADAHNFIMELPDGYGTRFENAPALSGGQKQRLALARALVRNPKIILLDEATSALDKESEAKIQKEIENFCIGRTAISITHRLNTIENCNCIYVINNKTIAERGDHNYLMNKKGQYYALKKFEFSA